MEILCSLKQIALQTCMFQLCEVTPTPLQGRGIGFIGLKHQPNPVTRNGGSIWAIQMFTLIFLLFSAERSPQKYTFAFSPHALPAKYCPAGFFSSLQEQQILKLCA